MKVLQINATYGYSSTGLIVKDIGDMLTKNGEQSYVAYQMCLDAPENGYKAGTMLDRKVHALLCRVFGKQGYYSKFETKKLLAYIDKIKPDIVHLHNLHSNYVHLNMVLDYLAKKDIATVITFHDCWYFTGKCFHYADIGCEGFMTGCGNCPKKKEAPRSLFFDWSSKVLKDRFKYLSKIPRLHIVGCSDWICSEARKGILKDFDISRIYNGVDIDIFKPFENNVLKEKYGKAFYIMGMANKWLLDANKNLLEEVVKILNDKLKLILVGCNEEQIKMLKDKSDNIIPVGFIKDRNELASYYNLADVFVNVTHVDTLPTVNMESICSATPVITYDSCGSPELILEGCGSVVKKGDVKGLINEILNVKQKISDKDLSKSRTVFDKNNCYKEYLSLYKALIEQKGR